MIGTDMLLAIDSGNTNIVFAVFDDDGTVMGEWRSSTDVNKSQRRSIQINNRSQRK